MSTQDSSALQSARPGRRSLVAAAAWATPAIAVDTAAPAMAASSDDVVASLVSCVGSGGDVTVTFRVCAVGSTVDVGSVFSLVTTGLAGVSTSGSLVSNSTVAGVSSNLTFTLTSALAANACYDLVVTLTSAAPLTVVTFATATILGNENLLPSTDVVIKTLSATAGC